MFEFLAEVFWTTLIGFDGQVVSGRGRAVVRFFFGVAGGVLCLGGGYVFVSDQIGEAGGAFLAASALLFAALAAFFFSIALNRGIRRAGWLVLYGFIGLFLARIVFGA